MDDRVWSTVANSPVNPEMSPLCRALTKSGAGGAGNSPALTRLIAEVRGVMEQINAAVRSGKLSARAARRHVTRLAEALAALGRPRSSTARRIQEGRRRPAQRRQISLRESVGCTLSRRGACDCPLCIPSAA